MKLRVYIIRIVYIALFCVIMWMSERVLYMRTPHGILQARAIYMQPKKSVDVALMGSSHVHCDINPAVLWHDHGIPSYAMTAAEQPTWVTYYYIRELCKSQDPKLIVLDLFAPAAFGDELKDRWMADNLYGVRFSPNKLEMLYNTCSAGQINRYFPSFFGYHSRYDEIELKSIPDLVKSEIGDYFKGYTGYNNVYTENNLPSLGITEKKEPEEKTLKFLKKIIDYTKKHDIELLLVVSPYPSAPEEEMIYNWIEDLARENDVGFVNANHDFEKIGLDLMTDYNDNSHLNIEGGMKYTAYLGNIIKENYDLPDRRGDEKYSSWEKYVSNYYK